MEPKQSVKNDFVFAIINNIPSFYHSSDLRNFFSQGIESNAFECFHFKHRPEVQRLKSTLNVSSTSTAGDLHQSIKQKSIVNTFCCVVKVRTENYKELLKLYNKKHWLDRKGESIPSLCSISEVRLQNAISESSQSSKYKTRGDLKKIATDRELFTLEDLAKMPEMNPPTNVMPNGNVGTSRKIFLDLIKQCKLPPNVIGKLGLTFPKSRAKRRYGNVPFEYEVQKLRKNTGKRSSDDPVNSKSDKLVDSADVVSASGHVLESQSDYKSCEHIRKRKLETTECSHQSDNQSDQESVQDADDCEEWERHEALYDDPANVERNKDRLFEEKIELKWEKGGSGLVFYTDAQFWKARSGGFDEETADDWDVDMSIYYEQNGGDKDSRDLVAMRQEQRRRDGVEATDLKTIGFWKDSPTIGSFEKHTRGIGRRVLERRGWQEGKGLGTSTAGGIAQAIDSDGQHPRDKRGLGYHGEKIQRCGLPTSNKKPKKDVIISTIYDNPSEIDPQEPLLRRFEPYHLRHRDLSVPYQAFHKPQDPQLQVLN